MTETWTKTVHLLFLMRAEVQKYVQVLELPGGPFDDELLQSRHSQIHPRLKRRTHQYNS